MLMLMLQLSLPLLITEMPTLHQAMSHHILCVYSHPVDASEAIALWETQGLSDVSSMMPGHPAALSSALQLVLCKNPQSSA